MRGEIIWKRRGRVAWVFYGVAVVLALASLGMEAISYSFALSGFEGEETTDSTFSFLVGLFPELIDEDLYRVASMEGFLEPLAIFSLFFTYFFVCRPPCCCGWELIGRRFCGADGFFGRS